MEALGIVLGVLVALVLLWALVFDRRHRGNGLTSHSPSAAARRKRIKDEQAGSEWGLGG